jgi:hypothetical protein
MRGCPALVALPIMVACGSSNQKPVAAPNPYVAGFPTKPPQASVIANGRALRIPSVSLTWVQGTARIVQPPVRRFSWPVKSVLPGNSTFRIEWRPHKMPDMAVVAFYTPSELSHIGVPDAAPKQICQVNASYPVERGCQLSPGGIEVRVPATMKNSIYVTVAALWVPKTMPKHGASLVNHQVKWAFELMTHPRSG